MTKPKPPPMPPDFYTARIREHNWPPGWEPQGGLDAGAQLRKEAALRASKAVREQERRSAEARKRAKK